MMISYEQQTQDSRNPVARLAHRNRLKRSLCLTHRFLRQGRLLDFGCGSGTFLREMEKTHPGQGVGYEPFMQERAAPDLPIHSTIEKVYALGPFEVITLFETIEHLESHELIDFLRCSEKLLTIGGGVLVSAPIEVGPVVLMKELVRMRKFRRVPELSLSELLGAAFLAKAPSRAVDIKVSHKGFDFRHAIAEIRYHGWHVRVLEYGPLPIRTWIGNSQVYLWLTKVT